MTLSHPARSLKKLDGFRHKLTSKIGPLNPTTKPNPYENADLLSGREPILRSSDRRRNECHRLCLIARLRVAEKYGSKPTGDELLQLAEAWWPRIRRSLEAAEAILNRGGDPTDRQAMAITRLTFAELLIRRAETHHLQSVSTAVAAKAMSDGEAKKVAENTAEKLRDTAASDHAEAIALLTTVESLLNEGRGENRWRFFYLLTRARAHMFKALNLRDGSRRQCLLQLHWAARHLVGATSNCGLWTDRYDVLGWWWDTWRSLAKGFFRHQPPLQFKEYLKHMKMRLGICWGSEEYPQRRDRWRVESESH